jgi:hypothetical protein
MSLIINSSQKEVCQGTLDQANRALTIFHYFLQLKLFFSIAPRLRNRINNERKYAEAIISTAIESQPDLPQNHPLRQLLKHF